MASHVSYKRPDMTVRVFYRAGYANARRRGQAWIGQVEWWDNNRPQPVLHLGDALDLDTAAINAAPGDLVAYGRWNKRKSTSTRLYAIVSTKGTLLPLTSTAAHLYWVNKKDTIPC